MNKLKAGMILLAILRIGPSAAHSQTWSDEQLDAWGFVESSWEVYTQKDPTWPDSYLHPSYSGWGDRAAMPVDRETIKKGSELDWPHTETSLYKLDPVYIYVQGDTAVVQYYLAWYFTYKDTDYGRQIRQSDFLIKEDGKWRLLASHGNRASDLMDDS